MDGDNSSALDSLEKDNDLSDASKVDEVVHVMDADANDTCNEFQELHVQDSAQVEDASVDHDAYDCEEVNKHHDGGNDTPVDINGSQIQEDYDSSVQDNVESWKVEENEWERKLESESRELLQNSEHDSEVVENDEHESHCYVENGPVEKIENGLETDEGKQNDTQADADIKLYHLTDCNSIMRLEELSKEDRKPARLMRRKIVYIDFWSISSGGVILRNMRINSPMLIFSSPSQSKAENASGSKSLRASGMASG